MTGAAAAVSAAPPELAGLDFRRTVDRRLVHRAAVAEVFLTDVREIGELRLAVAAQLPQSHLHYDDHLQDRPTTDPLLLVEVCRQAGIAGSHLLGVPADVAMLVNHFTLVVDDPHPLDPAGRPVELVVDTTYVPTKIRAGKVRRGHAEQRLLVAGRPVGRNLMEIQMVSGHEHDALRHLQRGTPAPSTAEFADLAHRARLEPAAVGRRHPLNVVLADVARDAGTLTAVVAPRLDNRALFDHAYDHVPAMALTEAARQLTLFALAARVRPGARITAVEAEFGRFAELDEPVLATLVPASPGRNRVEFRQGGAVVATVTVQLVTDHP